VVGDASHRWRGAFCNPSRMKMYMNNITWWLIVLLNFSGYFIYSFGQISRGNSKELIKFVGGVLFILSFGLMFFLFGGKYLIGLIVLSLIVVAFTVGLLIASIEKKLYGHYLEFEERYAKKLGMSADELRKVKNKTDIEILEETLPGIFDKKDKRDGFIQIPALIIIVSVLLASTGVGFVLHKKGKLPFITKKDNAIQPTSTSSPTPTQRPQSEVLEEDETEKTLIPTQKPNSLPADTFQPIPIPTPQPNTNSTVSIEICRSQAKEQRKEEEKKVNEEYVQSEPAMFELANTQNNGQTEVVALKYSYITEQDIVRSADVFMELVNEGYPTETAQSIAESQHSAYSAYLRSLHDWAVNELNKWYSAVTSRFDTYENEVFQSCLSSL